VAAVARTQGRWRGSVCRRFMRISARVQDCLASMGLISLRGSNSGIPSSFVDGLLHLLLMWHRQGRSRRQIAPLQSAPDGGWGYDLRESGSIFEAYVQRLVVATVSPFTPGKLLDNDLHQGRCDF